MIKTDTKPFLRYVGGKRWFVRNHYEHFPSTIQNYYEPFLGSAAIYTYLKSNNIIKEQSVLIDINEHLINTYLQIRKNPTEIISLINSYTNSKEEYYRIREEKPVDQLESAVRYLYLNRFSFGGIYRVNKNGHYNVPYGNRKYKQTIDSENLISFSNLLRDKTEILQENFADFKYSFNENTFFCLDPPYLDNSTIFKRYNQKPFNKNDNLELIELVKMISFSNSKFLLFVGDNIDFAKKIDHMGDVKILSRSNNLSTTKNGNSKIEIIVKNY